MTRRGKGEELGTLLLFTPLWSLVVPEIVVQIVFFKSECRQRSRVKRRLTIRLLCTQKILAPLSHTNTHTLAPPLFLSFY